MGTETGDIKHEEIWDDSALIDSWNEALEEYKVSRRVPQFLPCPEDTKCSGTNPTCPVWLTLFSSRNTTASTHEVER